MIGDSLGFLRKEWPRDMEAVSLDTNRLFSLRGVCPHCSHKSVFTMATGVGTEVLAENPPIYRLVSGMQCQGCRKYILGVVTHRPNTSDYTHEAHYPLGTPDDSVADDIPDEIKPDFKEALRCRWVDAYNATVEMCRRALESSCLQLGVDTSKLGTLEKMIDWVHGQGKITTPLKDMAHKIRLGGDRGAHPSERIMQKEDADAVIEFTREYFDHVYVMPARMANFDFSRPKPPKK
jgi:hypothetical protein